MFIHFPTPDLNKSGQCLFQHPTYPWPGSQVFRAEAMMLPEKATVETCLGPV